MRPATWPTTPRALSDLWCVGKPLLHRKPDRASAEGQNEDENSNDHDAHGVLPFPAGGDLLAVPLTATIRHR